MQPDSIGNSYIRPAVTLVFGGVFCWGFIAGMIEADVFVPIASMIITWWFKARDDQKKM